MSRPRRGWGHVRKLPSRKFQASYIGPDVLRHTAPVTFSMRTDAEGWLAQERRLVERGDWTPPGSRVAAAKATLTLRDYSATWVAQRALRPRSRAHYEALLANHIHPVVGDVEVAGLSAAQVRAWYAVTLTERPTYRANAYGLLHAICTTAVADGLLSVNPCQISRASVTHRKRQPVILSPAEVAKVAEEITPELRALVLLCAWCGLRFGEVTELRRKDVAEGAAALHVARGVIHRGGCHIDTPKNGRGRTVTVPPHIRGELKHHLDTFTGPDPEALLFAPATADGCHLRDDPVRVRFNAALARIGRQGVRIHDLRHFAGTQAARVGTLAETMAWLGHSTPRASLMYQGLISGRDVEMAEALSKLAEAPADNA